MDRTKWLIAVIGLVAMLGAWSVVYAHPVASNGGWVCPLTGQQVAVPQQDDDDWGRPGYYGRRHGTMGGGMMAYGRGYGHHRGYANCPYGNGNVVQNQALNEDGAKSLLQNYLNSTGNPNLKLGTVTDKEDAFEARIVTKDDSLVDTIQVDKKTGLIRFVR